MNPPRFNTFYPGTSAGVVAKVNQLANDPSVNGVVVDLDAAVTTDTPPQHAIREAYAKWDSIPAAPWEVGSNFRLTVRLLKPDGTEADTETGRSQHYSGSAKKVDFWYTVTPQDALMTGPWKLKIFNTVGASDAPRDAVNFDIENPAFPSFNSTFKAQCQ